MLLALDIGNTNIKSALFVGDELMDFTLHSNTDEAIEYINKTSISGAAICSVNPPVQKKIFRNISAKNVSAFEADIEQKSNLTIKYETPSTLGMDRVCSAVGALEIATNEKILSENQFLITIDFGTATTINIVSSNREFIGGLIAPGVSTMLKSLNDKTAQLSIPDQESYQGIIGNSTNSSIMSGVITSSIGLITETVNHVTKRSKVIPLVFATGGNAKYILPYLKHKVFLDEALVLKGLKVIYDLNN